MTPLRATNIILAVIAAVAWFALVLIIIRGRPFAISKRASFRIRGIVVGGLYLMGVSLVLLGGYTFWLWNYPPPLFRLELWRILVTTVAGLAFIAGGYWCQRLPHLLT
jgi:hypothetical protein